MGLWDQKTDPPSQELWRTGGGATVGRLGGWAVARSIGRTQKLSGGAPLSYKCKPQRPRAIR